MHTVELNAGRLIEVKVVSPITVADVDDIIQRVRMNVLGAPSRVVLCGDLTRLDALAPEWVAQFTAMFTRDNPKVERSAFLISLRRGALAIQLERMIREANNPARKVFDNADDLASYLAPVLTAAELTRLNTLVGRSPGAPGPKPGR